MKKPMSEADIQRAVADYLDSLGVRWCHPANGGARSSRTGGALKGQGVKRGVPDVLVFSRPASGESGLALELKTERGRVSTEQQDWIEALRECGWRAEVVRGLSEALAVIRECYGP